MAQPNAVHAQVSGWGRKKTDEWVPLVREREGRATY
jgi:hypothetical protein